jgi:hypothetical protein
MKKLQKKNHDKHLERKTLARQTRDQDKSEALQYFSILAFNFDL